MVIYQDRHPDNGIVYRRGILEFWVPSSMAKELPYNPMHLPTVKRYPDPMWYYMWNVCLELAERNNDVSLLDELLVEVLRR